MSSKVMEVRDASPGYGPLVDMPVVPEGYKQSEVGLIPKDWVLKKLPDVVWFQEGPGVRNYQFTRTGVKLFNGTNIEHGKINLEKTVRFISEHEAYGAYAHFLAQAGDIVIACSGITVERFDEKVSSIDSSHLPLCMNTSTMRFQVRPADVERGYFLQFLRSSYFKAQIGGSATGSAQLNFGPSHVSKVAIPIPSIEEQCAIATALSDVDSLLGALDRLIAKKRDIKQATMQQILTAQTRLPGFEGEWEMVRLGDHVTFLKNGVNSRAELLEDGQVRYLHYGDIHGTAAAILNPSSLPFLPSAKAKTLARLQDGDLVFADASEDKEGVGKSVELVGVGSTEIVSGLHTIAARFDKSVLTDGFKAYLQFCPEFISALRRLAAGTKVYATTRSHIAGVQMRLPKVKEQRAIATVFSAMDAEIEAIEQRRAKTAALKQAMMQELLTGRTRLV